MQRENKKIEFTTSTYGNIHHLTFTPFLGINKKQQFLNALGVEGNGYQWQIIIEQFVYQNYTFLEELSFNSEHGEFSVNTTNKKILRTIQKDLNKLSKEEFAIFVFNEVNKYDLLEKNIWSKPQKLTTGNLEYKRAIYNLANLNSLNTVYDFTLDNLNIYKDQLFTDIIRIEKDNGYHDRSREFTNWLYFRDATNWKRCKRTGLALTNKKSVFYGDITQDVILKTKTRKGKDWETAEHLILVQIDKDFKRVVIDVFKYFHTYKKPLIDLIIKEHQFCLK